MCKDRHIVFEVLILSCFSEQRSVTLMEVSCVKTVVQHKRHQFRLKALDEASLSARIENTVRVDQSDPAAVVADVLSSTLYLR
jgi:hypothetical protein